MPRKPDAPVAAAPPRVRSRRLQPADRRREIIAAAVICFAGKGYHATTPNDIAIQAGVTRPLLYRFFADKDELYLHVVREARERVDAATTRGIDPAADPGDQLRQGALAFFEFVRDDVVTMDLLYSTGVAIADSVAAEVIELRFGSVMKIAELMAAAAPQLGRPVTDAYAQIVYGAAEQLARWARRAEPIDPQLLTDRFLEAVWHGLGNGARPAPD